MSAPRSGIRGALRRLVQSPLRHMLMLVADGILAGSSLWLSLLLRFEGAIPPGELGRLPVWLAVLVASRVTASALLQLHRWSFRLSGFTDAVRLILSGLLGSGLFLMGIYLLQRGGPPRSVVVLELLLSMVFMGGLRFSPRLAWMYQADRLRARRPGRQRAIIVGAGATGEMLLRDLRRSREHSYVVVGFVDDDRGKWGSIVGGKPVLGDLAHLPELVERHRVATLLIAIPRVSPEQVRHILSQCAALKLRFKILPVSYLYLEERTAPSMLQDLGPEDLLWREPVRFTDRPGGVALGDRTALVTGAAGSIGSEICRQLLGDGIGRLVMVDFDENGLYLLGRRLERAFPGADIALELASIRESGRLRALFARHRPADVFHAAAHKHVPLMEAAPSEAVKNNVLGTLNVARVALGAGIERFVFLSTDKAVRPASVMGASKRLGEMAVRHLARAHPATRFCAVRFGNVLDSAGSVVPLFREQIAAGGPVTVTHPEVRRFFMTIPEAVGLVLRAAYGDYGELCVLEMGEPIRILDLARHMITMAGLAPETEVPIVFTGLRPGEKLSEELLTEEEERLSRVDDKIAIAQSPPPPADLDLLLEDLAAVAEAGDEERVVELLRRLVPSYGARAPAP